MALEQLNFDGLNKVEVAITRFKEFEPPEGYYLAFSGGKDSMVTYDLAMRSGVKFDAHYNVSPVDPPELRQFIKDNYADVAWDFYARNFWGMVSRKGLPLRHRRWCCEVIKEAGGSGRWVITGIRWAESIRRRARSMLERCFRDASKTFLHPIVDWSTDDVWLYIKERELPYCSLYDEGFDRLGCVLCPYVSARKTQIEMKRWPKITRNWKDANTRYFYGRAEKGKPFIDKSPEEFWQWWLSRK